MYPLFRSDSGAFTDLHGLVENAAADLNHLQVLFLFISGTFNVRHPAPLILLTGIDEVADTSVFIKQLRREEEKKNRLNDQFSVLAAANVPLII